MATENDKVNTGALATLVAVGTASMIGISLAVNALVHHELGNRGAERDATGELAYQTMKEEQLRKLSAPASWSDAGHVSLPIDRAMGLVLADLKRSPWNASPTPPPDAGPDAAAADTTVAGDAGTDASPTDTAPDAAAPEPPGSAPLSPSVPSTPPSAKPAPLAPIPRPSAAPALPKPPTPVAPTAAAPPAPPAPHAPAAPPAPPATP